MAGAAGHLLDGEENFGTFTFDYSPDFAAVECSCTFVSCWLQGFILEWVAVNECLWQIVMHQSPNLQPGFYDGRWIIVGNTFHSIPFPTTTHRTMG